MWLVVTYFAIQSDNYGRIIYLNPIKNWYLIDQLSTKDIPYIHVTGLPGLGYLKEIPKLKLIILSIMAHHGHSKS